MARPVKNNCDYFPHDGGMRNHRKIKAVITRFGLEGYAYWSILLEILTTTDDFTITLSSEIDWELMSSEFHTSSEKLKNFIDYVVTLSLLQKEGDKYWSDNLIERFSVLLNKRLRAKKAFEEGKEIEQKIGKKIKSTNGINRATRLVVYETCDFKCTCCGQTDPDVLDVHHIIPRYNQGTDEPSNLTLLCANCHRKEHSCQVSVTETQLPTSENTQSKVKESKLKESIIDTPPVFNPNLQPGNNQKQPNIPTYEAVWECFSRNGGTKEMAKSFYDTHQSTGWFYKGSPMVSFTHLVSGYVTTWKKFESKNGGTVDSTNVKIRAHK